MNTGSRSLHPHRQAIWGHMWKYTVEKSQTNATSATTHALIQVLWGDIWKDTMIDWLGTNRPSWRLLQNIWRSKMSISIFHLYLVWQIYNIIIYNMNYNNKCNPRSWVLVVKKSESSPVWSASELSKVTTAQKMTGISNVNNIDWNLPWQ